MIVVKIWKLTKEVRVTLAPRSSHSQSQALFRINPMCATNKSPQQGDFLTKREASSGFINTPKVRQIGHSLFCDAMIFPVFVLPYFPPQKFHAPFSLILTDTNKTSSITPYRST